MDDRVEASFARSWSPSTARLASARSIRSSCCGCSSWATATASAYPTARPPSRPC